VTRSGDGRPLDADFVGVLPDDHPSTTPGVATHDPFAEPDERTDPGAPAAPAWNEDGEGTDAGHGPQIIADDGLGAWERFGVDDGAELDGTAEVDNWGESLVSVESELVLGVPVVPAPTSVKDASRVEPAHVSPVILAAARDGREPSAERSGRARGREASGSARAVSKAGRSSEGGPSASPSPSNVARVPMGADPWVGRFVANRYRIERAIAAGGMGRVYLATQLPLGRPVAVKVMRGEMAGSRQHFLRRFFLEASACAKLTHPNIITLHDYGETDDNDVFMAMEYLDGRSLDREIKDTAPMAPERALHIAIQITRALREAHGKGIIHRDLKPQNVMLVEQGDERDFVKVLDFGLVKMLTADETEQELTRAGTLLGSPNYMSPEQILGGMLDHRSDIYSLGVVLFKMLTGMNPYARDADTDVIYKHVYHPIPTIASTGVSVTDALDGLVQKCLAKKADDRFSDCKELVLALKEARRDSLGQGGKRRRRAEAPAPVEPEAPVVVILGPEESPSASPSAAPEATELPTTFAVAEDLGPARASAPPRPSASPARHRVARPFRLDDVASTPVYLRARGGGAIGPFAREELDLLYCARVVDDDTPVSVDGASFGPIADEAALRTRVAAFRDAVTAGQRPWERAEVEPLRSPLDALARCAAGKATGVLVAERVEGELRLHYVDGKIIEVASTAPALGLASFLVDKGVVARAELDDRLPVPPARSGDLGDALIAHGLLAPHVLMERMVEWARHVVGRVFACDVAELRFEPGVPPQAQIPLALDRWAVLTEVVRGHVDRDVVERAMRAVESRTVMPGQVEGLGVDVLKLQPKELRIVRGIDGTKTLIELVGAQATTKEQREALLRLLYLMLGLGLLTLGEDAMASKDRAEAQRILDVLDKLRGKTPFEVLNAKESASDEDLRARFMDLAKQYHTDAARPGAAPELLDAMRAIFAFVQETYATIESNEKREKYRQIRALGYTGREPEEEVVRRVLEAEIGFKKAKTLVRLNKFDEALGEMRDAVAKKPKDVELRIHLRYYEFLATALNRAAEAERCLAEVVAMMKGDNAELISGLLIQAKLLKVLHREDAAIKVFRRVLKQDPKNHEAESEVRLLTMREERKAKDKRSILGAIGGAISGKDKG
jgi:serine/threonine protein kinase/tetratricopeptide (TPR) repeat protein